jgi:hypothetical protein
MTTTLIVAQVFAFFAFILYTLSFQFKKRGNVLKTQIFANIFYTLEYVMLNAYAGVNNSLFGITRSVLFYTFDKKKKKCPPYVAVIFLTLVVIFGFISYTDIFSILPVIISIIFFVALYTEDMKLYRKIAVIASILWIIYNIAVHAYVSVFDYTIELISSLIAIYRFDIKKEREKAKEKDKIKKLK